MIDEMKLVCPGARTEVLYIVAGASLGYCIHRIAYLYVQSKANKPAHYAPRNVDKKIERFFKAFHKLRGGELSLITVAAAVSQALGPAVADAIAHAAVDAAGSVICGGSVSGMFFLVINKWGRKAIGEASLHSLYSMALVPLNSGIMVAKVATDIVCSISEEFIVSILTSNLSENVKKNEIDKFLFKFNLTTHNDRISFIMCFVSLGLFLLNEGYMDSFLLLIHQILEAVRSGRLPRFQIVRLILRILRRHGAPVDPEII